MSQSAVASLQSAVASPQSAVSNRQSVTVSAGCRLGTGDWRLNSLVFETVARHRTGGGVIPFFKVEIHIVDPGDFRKVETAAAK